MKEYYELKQGMTGQNGDWLVAPSFITDRTMLTMLANGLAKALGHTKPNRAAWGTGVYERNENGEYVCVKSNWDSSD